MGDFPDWTVPTNIQNPQIDVNVVGGEINANITNAEIDTVIKESKVVLDVTSQRLEFEYVTVNDGRPTPNLAGDLYNYTGIAILHGAQGFIERIEVDLKEEAGINQIVDIYFTYDWRAPFIKVGSFTVEANFSGTKSVLVNYAWSHDTLFVLLKAGATGLLVYADDSEPYFGVTAGPDQVIHAQTWTPHIRIKMYRVKGLSVKSAGETTAYLLGWDNTNNKWVRVRVTEDGKLSAVLG